jgi:molybdopterin/thiamine biosynthesis adenylyltransferase
MMTNEEMKRYSRQRAIIGTDGQERLKKARVLVAGAGGLGTIVSTYLTAAGIGFLRIADYDVVEASNLNRQILHWTKDIGRQKTESVEEKLKAMNPQIEIEKIPRLIDETDVDDIVRGIDLIVDAMDNFATRYLLNRAAVKHDVPFFHGGIRETYGQVTTVLPGRSACLRCIFPEGPPPAALPVLGATCGVIGAIQATEVVKYITGRGDLLTNRLLIWDGLSAELEIIEVKKNPACIDCGTKSKSSER